jgi:hypothetical protein
MRRVFSSILAVVFVGIGCGTQTNPPAASSCATAATTQVGGSSGSALVFNPDPIVASGNASLAPTSLSLDQYRSDVALSNLNGNGVLSGKYVNIIDSNNCQGGYDAYDSGNKFEFSHSDIRFQAAMAYYFGDQYRAHLDELGVLAPSGSVNIDAHCEKQDNAYFMRVVDPNTGKITSQGVCLGDSVETPGAFYADDGTVTVHELEHATTVNSYSPVNNLGTLWYDEGGSLNEAISDYMALVHLQPLLAGSALQLDPRVFSRWALGTYFGTDSEVRGANKCPVYDSQYPNCGGFPGFSAANGTISYVYPDGVGWPYSNNYSAPGYASQAFQQFSSQEEIHNAGVLMEGALWDVYNALAALPGHDQTDGEKLATSLVLRSVKDQVAPSTTSPAPVTYLAFAATMVADAAALGFSAAEQQAVTQALTARGLVGAPQLPANWMSAPAGTTAVQIVDNAQVLRSWLTGTRFGFSLPDAEQLVPQGLDGGGINGLFDPGETDMIWFNLEDTSTVTAGSVLLTVTAQDPEITFLDGSVNVAPISSTSAQVIYQKVNGTSIVMALSSPNSTLNVPTGNTYFATDPLFAGTFTTGLWVQVAANAAHGKTVHFSVQAQPANGPAVTQVFTTTIH